MNRNKLRAGRIFAVLATLVATVMPEIAVSWEPDEADERQVRAAAEIEQMLAARPQLQSYFDEAYGYAIFPGVVRIAAGFGAVYGSGMVIEMDRLVGTTWQIQGNLGFTFGGQLHSQVIFFRDADILEEFKTGRFEFQGRASALLITLGGAVDPGFKSQVAIFTRTRGGLMVELAAAATKFGYKPLQEETPDRRAN